MANPITAIVDGIEAGVAGATEAVKKACNFAADPANAEAVTSVSTALAEANARTWSRLVAESPLAARAILKLMKENENG